MTTIVIGEKVKIGPDGEHPILLLRRHAHHQRRAVLLQARHQLAAHFERWRAVGRGDDYLRQLLAEGCDLVESNSGHLLVPTRAVGVCATVTDDRHDAQNAITGDPNSAFQCAFVGWTPGGVPPPVAL